MGSTGVSPRTKPVLGIYYDLPEPLTLLVDLFADDTVVYCLVTPNQLQEDLLKLQLWEKSWDMVFHP